MDDRRVSQDQIEVEKMFTGLIFAVYCNYDIGKTIFFVKKKQKTTKNNKNQHTNVMIKF